MSLSHITACYVVDPLINVPLCHHPSTGAPSKPYQEHLHLIFHIYTSEQELKAFSGSFLKTMFVDCTAHAYFPFDETAIINKMQPIFLTDLHISEV